ncbi:hypothetical protein GOODEAATRI_004521 [Goodea atripinnis]|uniref:Uncharacterized protein n=1 Tax=Goodea atripinnis TaxID=208336 RepID=A0ABV0PVA1_9TELE
MMHYSNWLIDVKNRASLRNACRTTPDTGWINSVRNNGVDTQNNNLQPNENISELLVTTHLWRKGKTAIKGSVRRGSTLLRQLDILFEFPSPLQVRAEGEGVLRYHGNGQLTGRSSEASANNLNPLFPGTNELDQVAKIHNVLGTPDQSLLQKFKQAMHFNFPPKKGTGISRLLPSCPAPALSLLYQMLAYDSDERITAETALTHTYFREIR